MGRSRPDRLRDASRTRADLASRRGQTLVFVGIVVLALNLRPAAVSVGPMLGEIRSGLSMSSTQAGVLTSLPVIAFGLFGALAPLLSARVGRHRLTVASLVAIALGLVGRSSVDSVPLFLLLSLLALVGMATANVVMPSLVKQHFPERIAPMTAIYSTALAIGLTSGSVLTVPASQALGGWRLGLASWALVALLALLPWVLLMRHDSRGRAGQAPVVSKIALASVARTRLGWLMAAFFGLQSLHAYAIFGWFAEIFRDAGFSSTTAGLLLGLITGTSIPLSLLVPLVAGRLQNVTPLLLSLLVCYPVGYVGLIVAPHAGAVAWAVLVGIGTCTFPLVLTLIGLRSRTAEGTASLSAFTQSVGYLLAAAGPFGVGFLHDLTGGWTVPLIALTVLVLPLAATGLAVAGPAFIEDELPGLSTLTAPGS